MESNDNDGQSVRLFLMFRLFGVQIQARRGLYEVAKEGCSGHKVLKR